MDAKNLAGITEQLEKERAALSSKAEKLRTDLSGIEGDLKKITAAISALNGTAEAAPKKASKPKKAGKRAAGKADVIKIMNAILADEAVLDQDELRQRIEETLTSDGFSRLGFALRFKEAIADPQFVDSPGGIRLADAKALVH